MTALKRKKMREIAGGAPPAALLVALALIMATVGCSPEPGGASTVLEGLWENASGKAEFKGDSFTITVSIDGAELELKGAFILSGSQIGFTVTQFSTDGGANWKPFTEEAVKEVLGNDFDFNAAESQTGTFSIDGNQLTLTFNGESLIFYKDINNIPGKTRANAIQLTENRKVDGNINSSLTEVWYKFNVSNETDYWVWLDDWDNRSSSGKTLDAQIAAYYNNEDEAIFEDEDVNKKPFTAEKSGTVYVKVYPFSSGDTGTFGIAYSTTDDKPVLPVNVTRLTEDRWTKGDILSPGGEEWFSFTASAATQYIHVYFGSLSNMYVQLYDADGDTVEAQANLYSSTTNINRPVTSGQLYYIKITPRYTTGTNSSGTYGITYNKSDTRPATPPTTPGSVSATAQPWSGGITVSWSMVIDAALNVATDYVVYRSTSSDGIYTELAVIPGGLTNIDPSYKDTTAVIGTTYYYKVSARNGAGESEQSAFRPGTRPIVSPLSEDVWTNGNIPTSNGEQWFSFTATAETQYIHVYFGSLTDLYVRLCDVGGTTVGAASTNLYSYGSTSYINRSVTIGQTYYIRVWPYGSYSGSFGITFNAENTRPDTPPTTPANLSSNAAPWAEGITLSWNTVGGATGYVVYRSTSSTGTFTEIGTPETNSYLDDTVTSGPTYYYKVSAVNSAGEGGQSNPTPGTRMPTVIPLTEGDWADGNIPTSSGEQWFSFTATAATQYIHAYFGTLTDLYVRLYDSEGTAIGYSSSNLWSSTGTGDNTYQTVTPAEDYYIRVWPYSNNYSGTYQITFNTSSTRPPVAPPTSVPVVSNAAGPWGGIIVSWNSVSGAEEYVVYRSASETGNFTEIATIDTTRYLDTTAVSDTTTYYYKVAAKNRFGEGEQSSVTSRLGTAPATITPLTVDVWADGNIPTSGGEQWFSFTATTSPQYIHANFDTLNDVYVQLYSAEGITVEDRANLYDNTTSAARPITSGQLHYIRVWPYNNSDSGEYQIMFTASNTRPPTRPDRPSAPATTALPWGGITVSWTSVNGAAGYALYRSTSETGDYTLVATIEANSHIDTTATIATETYYYRIAAKNNVGESGQSNPSPGRPGAAMATVTPLTESIWANGNIATANDQQWFKFTATANSHYVHFILGTLTNLYFQLYDANGNTVGAQAIISGSITNPNRTVTIGQEYYIKTSYYMDTGTYQIVFHNSIVPPGP